MKKHLTKFLFLLTAIVCLSISTPAQKQDEKKGDQRNPPQIEPNKERKPKNDKPKDKGDEKKPVIVLYVTQEEIGST